jgi:hypothetical protein
MGLIRLEFGAEDGRIGVMQGTVLGTPAENKPKLLDQVRTYKLRSRAKAE